MVVKHPQEKSKIYNFDLGIFTYLVSQFFG